MAVQDQLNALTAHQNVVFTEGLLLNGPVLLRAPHTTAHGGVSATTYSTIIDTGGGPPLEAFHKPASGVDVNLAAYFGHEWDEPQVHDAAAWVVAKRLGSPITSLVCICVVRQIEGENGSLSAKKIGDPPKPGDIPGIFATLSQQVDAAAFFDALIGQQDRHLTNFRYDAGAQRIGLIDHGFAFARPAGRSGLPDYYNYSAFVYERHTKGRAQLSDLEVAQLDTVVHSPDQLGLAGVLADERLQAFVDRAQHMRSSGQLLRPGHW